MQPVRTARSNLVYKGPTPDIGDAWTESKPGVALMTWQPTDDERDAITKGAMIVLGVFQHPMPPVSLGITHDKPLTDEGARWIDRARNILKPLAPDGPLYIPAGYWYVSDDVWQALQANGALAGPGVPLLADRPLMRSVDADLDTLEFVPHDEMTLPDGGLTS